MKRVLAYILVTVMLFLFCACSKPAAPASSSASPASSDEAQPHYTGPDPDDTIIYPSLNAVTPNADAKKLTADEVDLLGLTNKTTSEDLVQMFGEPREIVASSYMGDIGIETYVYDNMRFTFIRTVYDQPVNYNGIYVAQFKKDDLTYPRGIKLGDSLFDVVAKFPQDRDYRSEVMYGNHWDKYNAFFAKLLDYDTFTQEHGNYTLLICCNWWPTVCINFDDDLKTESVYIYYDGRDFGYP